MKIEPTGDFPEQPAGFAHYRGYYDRTIAQWEAQGHEPLLIGAVWADARLGSDYESLAHDKAIDAIVSDRGISFF